MKPPRLLLEPAPNGIAYDVDRTFDRCASDVDLRRPGGWHEAVTRLRGYDPDLASVLTRQDPEVYAQIAAKVVDLRTNRRRRLRREAWAALFQISKPFLLALAVMATWLVLEALVQLVYLIFFDIDTPIQGGPK